MMHVYNSSPLDAEAGGSQVPGLSGLDGQTLLQNQDNSWEWWHMPVTPVLGGEHRRIKGSKDSLDLMRSYL